MPHGDLKAVEAPHNERLVMLAGIVTLGASGAISSQDCVGFTVTKTGSEVGRYTITLLNKFLKLMYGHAVLEITADAAPVQNKGSECYLRGVNAAGKVAYFQFAISPTAAAPGADVEVEDSAKIRIMLVCSRGKA